MTRERKEYLGDGVYASHDGWHIWLTTDRGSDGGVQRIALEPEVFASLVRYEAELRAAAVAEPSETIGK